MAKLASGTRWIGLQMPTLLSNRFGIGYPLATQKIELYRPRLPLVTKYPRLSLHSVYILEFIFRKSKVYFASHNSQSVIENCLFFQNSINEFFRIFVSRLHSENEYKLQIQLGY